MYRAIDSDSHLVDVFPIETRDQTAAEAFFRSALAVTSVGPKMVISDKRASQPPALDEVFGDDVEHRPAARTDPPRAAARK